MTENVQATYLDAARTRYEGYCEGPAVARTTDTAGLFRVAGVRMYVIATVSRVKFRLIGLPSFGGFSPGVATHPAVANAFDQLESNSDTGWAASYITTSELLSERDTTPFAIGRLMLSQGAETATAGMPGSCARAAGSIDAHDTQSKPPTHRDNNRTYIELPSVAPVRERWFKLSQPPRLFTVPGGESPYRNVATTPSWNAKDCVGGSLSVSMTSSVIPRQTSASAPTVAARPWHPSTVAIRGCRASRQNSIATATRGGVERSAPTSSL